MEKYHRKSKMFSKRSNKGINKFEKFAQQNMRYNAFMVVASCVFVDKSFCFFRHRL